MRFYILATLVVLLSFAAGCSASLPECGDKETKDLIAEILKMNDMDLLEISSVKTVKRENESCQCSARAKVRFMGEEMEDTLEYLITFSDDKKKFNIKITN